MSVLQCEIVSDNKRDNQNTFQIIHSSETSNVNAENSTCSKCNKTIRKGQKITLQREATSINNSSKIFKKKNSTKHLNLKEKKLQIQENYRNILTVGNRNKIITNLGDIITNIQQIVELL